MGTTGSVAATVADAVAALEGRYPPAWSQEWDRVGLVLGEPRANVRRVLCVIDLDAAHWATERPWLDHLAAYLRDTLAVEAIVSDLDSDPWTLHVASPPRGADNAPILDKEDQQ